MDKKTSKHKKCKRSEEGIGAVETLLTLGLLQNSKMLNEFPTLVAALDNGESVNISSISSTSYKELLSSLFAHLPLVKHSDGVWSRSDGLSVGDYILKLLLDQKSIVQPAELSEGQTSSFQAIPKVLDLLNGFSPLKDELPALFTNLLEGGKIDLDGIQDEDVRNGLQRIFVSLNLENSNSGYEVPSGSAAKIVTEAIKGILRVFKSDELGNHYLMNLKKSSDIQIARSIQKREVSSSSSDEDSDNDCNSSRSTQSSCDVASSPSVRKLIGPSMPTTEQMQCSETLVQRYKNVGENVATVGPALPPGSMVLQGEEDDNSDSDDSLGPTPSSSYGAVRSNPYTSTEAAEPSVYQEPLGLEGSGIKAVNKPRPTVDPSTGQEISREDGGKKVGEREEWMINPGEAKSTMALLTEAFVSGTGRKFAVNKDSRKLAAALVKQREIEVDALQNSEEHKVNQSIIPTFSHQFSA